ncbi:hypothetical protein AALP_AA3G178100 [Arabis alpina]|uniref:F-box domain-containing protein n=1 Tax=Arabis alpina TaxID=50452 RepID=A0A087H9X2_ARAAL|nr:hypothetical protein AALP_AA3G178100 [Arabis alpina]
MTTMNNLPIDLVEEILSRVPVTSLRRIRSTCKKWNTLCKDGTFTEKHLTQVAERKGEILTILLINCKLNLKSVNLRNDCFDPSIRHRGNLISLSDSDKLDITRVYHCDGLVLCLTEDYTRFVVWNPYTGQTRWICAEPIPGHHTWLWYGYALGHDKSTHKVLRFARPGSGRPVHEIYDLNSNLWRVLDVTQDWDIMYGYYGMSLKGNMYWFAQNEVGRGSDLFFFFLTQLLLIRTLTDMPEVM